jgi:hypothetical protein
VPPTPPKTETRPILISQPQLTPVERPKANLAPAHGKVDNLLGASQPSSSTSAQDYNAYLQDNYQHDVVQMSRSDFDAARRSGQTLQSQPKPNSGPPQPPPPKTVKAAILAPVPPSKAIAPPKSTPKPPPIPVARPHLAPKPPPTPVAPPKLAPKASTGKLASGSSVNGNRSAQIHEEVKG